MKTKTFRLRVLSVLLATLFAMAGCVQQQQEDDNTQLIAVAALTASYQVKEGTVNFQDHNAFDDFIKALNGADGEALFNAHQRRLANLGPEQFKPLTPAYDYENQTAIRAFDAQKRARIAAENPHLTATQVANMEIDDEDDIIADPYFAALLNTDRELVVGSTRYKYTASGVFSAPKNNVNQLRAVARSFRPDTRKYSQSKRYNVGSGVQFFPQDFAKGVSTTSASPGGGLVPSARLNEQFIKPSECHMRSVTARQPDTRRIPSKGDQLRFPDEKLCGGGGGGGGGSGGGSTGGSSGPPAPPPITSFPKCTKMATGLFAKLFGPKIVCVQKWEKRKRIKTKMWNQNYLVYASIGISVRSQSRFLRIWWAKKTDELILGYNSITFDYKMPPINPAVQFGGLQTSTAFKYSYRGHTWNQYGQWQNPGGKLWNTTSFPITNVNNNWLEVQVYLPVVHNVGKTISTTDLNNYAEKALRSAIKDFVGNLAKPDKETPTVVSALTQQKIRYIHHNWKRKKKNVRNIRNIFDWNTAQIGITATPGSGNGPKLNIAANARSYDLIIADLYGIGRRGRSWKGSRIEFSDK